MQISIYLSPDFSPRVLCSLTSGLNPDLYPQVLLGLKQGSPDVQQPHIFLLSPAARTNGLPSWGPEIWGKQDDLWEHPLKADLAKLSFPKHLVLSKKE